MSKADSACYTAAEVAAKLGMSVDYFYKAGTRDDLYAQGMPRSVTNRGRLRFPKRAFDAWLDRDHPLMPKAPAAEAPDDPQHLREWGAFLDSYYSKH